MIRSNVGLYLFYKGIHLKEKQVSEIISRAIIIDLAAVVQKSDNTIHWRVQFVSLTLIHWIVIYLLDSAIQLLNNRGQKYIWQGPAYPLVSVL